MHVGSLNWVLSILLGPAVRTREIAPATSAKFHPRAQIADEAFSRDHDVEVVVGVEAEDSLLYYGIPCGLQGGQWQSIPPRTDGWGKGKKREIFPPHIRRLYLD
ncbi:hypothetical protein N7467_011692 [Penicillium canescens]|nr:hypothetical protein N7467_011692 [Penicillium canescens]